MSKNDIKSYSSNNDAGANNRLTLKQQRFVDSYIRKTVEMELGRLLMRDTRLLVQVLLMLYRVKI